MKKQYFLVLFFIFSFAFTDNFLFAEGTKQLMPDSLNNITNILITRGMVGGQYRDSFALEGASPSYRLYIHISNNFIHEQIRFGIGEQSGTSGNVPWKIYNPAGTVVFNNTTPSVPGSTGFIQYYSQANYGPDVLSPHGYPSFSVTPTMAGDYYMTFTLPSAGSQRVFTKLDITVIDVTNPSIPVAIDGRVFTRCWQFSNPQPWSSNRFAASMYIYSLDQIVTKLNPNQMEGRDFSFSCNESGCFRVDATHNVQQARMSQPCCQPHTYPEYKIFLNNPDPPEYPDGTIGSLVPNSVSTVTDCNSGTIMFIFETQGTSGSVEVDLTLSGLSPPLTNRVLIQSVQGGIDTIVWDGKDGNGVQVPSGSTFVFTLTYTNGLTHLPLWDVENNDYGFKVSLVRPVQTPPLPDPNFFWNDSLVNGSIMTTSPGCNSSTTGCHIWSGEFGDQKSMNTWWYLVSSSTLATSITYKKNPGNLGTISGPSSVCQGGTYTFSVTPDPCSQQYTWTTDFGTKTTTSPSVNISFPTNAIPGPSIIRVAGVNAECGSGPQSTKAVTVIATATVNPPAITSICSGSTLNVMLSSTPPGATFSWNSPAPFCSSNIASCPPGVANGTQINDILSITDPNPGLVTYTIQPTLGTCPGLSYSYTVNVYPIPNVTCTASQTICSGSGTTPVTLFSTTAGTTYAWTTTGTAGITGFAPSGSGNPIPSEILSNSTTSQGSITYTITPSYSTCTGTSTTHTAYVNPLPVVTNSPMSQTICSGSTSSIVPLTASVNPSTFTWTASTTFPITGFSASGTSTIPAQTLINSGSVQGFVIYHIIPVSQIGIPCTGTPVDYYIYVNPLPSPAVNGSNSVCAFQANTVYSTINIPGNNYSWTITGGTITSGANSNSTTVTWGTAGTGKIKVTETVAATGCVKADSLNVTIHNLPSPSIAGTNFICAGSSNVIYSTQPGMTNYIWVVSSGGAITAGGGTGNSTVTVTWNTPGSQSVSVNYNDPNGCAALAPVTYAVTVNPLPVPSINGPSAVCQNATGIYNTQTGMTGYLWNIPPGGTIVTGSGTNSITVLWSTTGSKTITVNYTDPNGCTALSPASFNVMVDVLPVPSLTGLNSICINNSTVYITDPGMNSYLWNVSSGGSIISGGTVNDNTVTVLWNTAGSQTVSVNYNFSTGCTASSPTILNITVKPRPAVTNAANSSICSGSAISLPLQADLAGTTFSWTATPSSASITGAFSGNGSVITDTLVNTGSTIETVTYAVTPSLNGCDGTVSDFVITIYPVATVVFSPDGQAFCSGGMTSIALASPVAGASFSWTVLPSSANVTGYLAGSGNSISQTLSNTGYSNETVIYIVTPSISSCTGITDSVTVTVHPLPTVSFISCMDAATTTAAKPMKLKGGNPLGGMYSGAGVNTGIFYPGVAGPGLHTLTYSYSNIFGCSASATQNINVITAGAFFCNNILTDVRDNKQYTTVQIGSQCWMAVNLNYGNVIASSAMQRDNCIPEKYCYQDNPALCTMHFTLYQWDELMQYGDVAGSQGLCPPGWHIPSEGDWQTLFAFYISNGFAGSPLKYTGYSGFDAFLSGVRFNNTSWNFDNFAVMFWSSTSHGSIKAWAHGMNIYNPSVSFYPSNRSNAFSVRCIKD